MRRIDFRKILLVNKLTDISMLIGFKSLCLIFLRNTRPPHYMTSVTKEKVKRYLCNGNTGITKKKA